MPLFAWKQEFSVGVPSIDAQHKKLMELINVLYNAMKSGSGKDVIDKVLSELVAYTKYHFEHEERVLRETGYAQFLTHKQEHESLTKKVVELEQNFNTGTAALSMEVLEFLKNWLLDHILRKDKAYSVHVTVNGAH